MLLERQNERRGLCTSVLCHCLGAARLLGHGLRLAQLCSKPVRQTRRKQAGFSEDERRNSTGNTSMYFSGPSRTVTSGTWTCQMTSATAGKRLTKKYEARVDSLLVPSCSPTGVINRAMNGRGESRLRDSLKRTSPPSARHALGRQMPLPLILTLMPLSGAARSCCNMYPD